MAKVFRASRRRGLGLRPSHPPSKCQFTHQPEAPDLGWHDHMVRGKPHSAQTPALRPLSHTRPWSIIRDRIGRLCARVRGLVVTVKP
jgi:hypothetical protein